MPLMTIVKYLNPRNDLVFKKIFGTEKNKDILIHFINDVIVEPDKPKVKTVTLLNPHQFPDIAVQKQSVVDVLCEDEAGINYIVEMQVAKVKGFEKRAQHYAARVYGGQAVKGGIYPELKEVIFLALTEYNMFPNKKGYKCTHWILDKDTYERDLKDFSFTFIELTKFNKKLEDLVTYEDKWCYFFKHADDPDNVDELVANTPEIIQKACHVIEAHNWTKEELIQYEERERIATDLQSTQLAEMEDAIANAETRGEARGKAEGEAKGKAEGEAKGKAEGILAVAKNMLSEKIDLKVISKVTGLSEAEIKKLKP